MKQVFELTPAELNEAVFKYVLNREPDLKQKLSYKHLSYGLSMLASPDEDMPANIQMKIEVLGDATNNPNIDVIYA